MIKLPRISGRAAIKKFEKIGYEVVRQKGSHIRLIHPTNESCKALTVPDHRELGTGLLRKLLRDAQMTLEDFLEL